MHKNKKWIVACVAMAVSAFGLGVTLQTQSVAATETGKEAILYYDFSADTIGENVNGYSSVTNLGTKANANATIFNGTGVCAVYDQLVFNQPENATLEEGKQKGYFELPTKSFEGLTTFTVQMDVSGWDAGGDREPIFAMTPTSLSTTTYGDYNQGLLIGDGWTSNDYTFMESYFGGWSWTTSTQRPFITGTTYLLTFVYDGANASFYANNTLLLQKANSDSAVFAAFDYFRIGGLIYGTNNFQALKANIDTVKLYDYARTSAQLEEDVTALNERASQNKRAKVYYDFANANADGTVENLGTGVNMNGRIVETKDDVYISDGKLVIANDGSNDKANGYFRLPDNLLKVGQDWSIVMDVDRLVCLDNQPAMFYFGAVDPTTKTDTELSETKQLQLFMYNNAPYYQATGAGADNLWTGGTANVINNPEDGQRTIALIYKDGVASLYYYQKYEAGVNPTKIFETPKAVDFYYWDMVFNKIGGYILSWGRSSSDLKIDSFAFFDYAITTSAIVNFPLNVEYITATLPDTATSLTSYSCYNREGAKVNRSDLIFPENIDFATEGVKEYVVWRSNVASQPTPIRFTLTTTHTHADADNDNDCDACGKIIDGIGKAYGINLSLEGTISVNVYMSLTEATVADTGAYMHSTYGDKVIDVNIANARLDTSSGETYYVFSMEVPAKDMDKEITSYIVRSNGDEGVKYTYSVETYAEKLLADTTGAYDSAKPLMNAMLAYGKYAKAFFAGETLDATAEMNAVTQETLGAYAPTATGTLPEGMNIVGTTLTLESETTIRIYFTVSNAIDNYTFAVNGTSVEAIAVGNVYCVEITDISAKDLDTAYEITVNDSLVITYSAMSYARTAIGSSDASLVKLAQALYLYNQAANEYFSNN